MINFDVAVSPSSIRLTLHLDMMHNPTSLTRLEAAPHGINRQH